MDGSGGIGLERIEPSPAIRPENCTQPQVSGRWMSILPEGAQTQFRSG
ncbi:MAG: hypothetical protein IPN20_03730 [Haliscomenobacter sp.]|nr:hypothetical protein [Haliscomenobacter sp.]